MKNYYLNFMIIMGLTTSLLSAEWTVEIKKLEKAKWEHSRTLFQKKQSLMSAEAQCFVDPYTQKGNYATKITNSESKESTIILCDEYNEKKNTKQSAAVNQLLQKLPKSQRQAVLGNMVSPKRVEAKWVIYQKDTKDLEWKKLPYPAYAKKKDALNQASDSCTQHLWGAYFAVKVVHLESKEEEVILCDEYYEKQQKEEALRNEKALEKPKENTQNRPFIRVPKSQEEAFKQMQEMKARFGL